MKKINAYQDLTNQHTKKISYYLSNSTRKKKAIFLFDHGLGDYVEFLTLFNTVQKLYPDWTLKIGYHSSLGFDGLHPDGISLGKEYESENFVLPIGLSIVQNPNVLNRYDIWKLAEEYEYIFGIQYYDYFHPNVMVDKIANPKCKNEMCKVLEFGLPEKTPLIPYHIKVPDKIKTNKVAFHFNGNTDKNSKTPDLKVQEQIWNEIIETGYDPIDVHQNAWVSISNSKQPLPNFIKDEQSLRNKNGGISLLVDTIRDCNYCIGILSGPLHLANNILGPLRCIGVQKNFEIKNFVGDGSLRVVDGKNYIPGTISKLLGDMEISLHRG